jgi:23S rRNA (cytosine1962-C5)-methyltransferase
LICFKIPLINGKNLKLERKMDNAAGSQPIFKINSGGVRRARAGHPWIYSNEVAMTPELKATPRGTLLQASDEHGRPIGLYAFNPNTLIAGRRFADAATTAVDADFLAARLKAALALRQKLFDAPYYRLVHAEADGLPGLIIDRFGDTLVLQLNSAAMDRLQSELLAAVETVLAPVRIILKNDSPSRQMEGIECFVKVVKGAETGPVSLVENGVDFLCDPVGGQKTGWFYDHRDNRAFIAGLSAGARVIDFYCYAGSFSLQCAKAGAAHVVGVDRSEGALVWAEKSAELNGVKDKVEFRRAEAFAEMERLASAGVTFDVVIADPPAFVKSKKDLSAGARGYRKMTKMASRLVAPGGFLLVASCSHHVDPVLFAEQVRLGLADAGRGGRIIRASGAAPDHPVHQFLPETAYLKAQVHQLD